MNYRQFEPIPIDDEVGELENYEKLKDWLRNFHRRQTTEILPLWHLQTANELAKSRRK